MDAENHSLVPRHLSVIRVRNFTLSGDTPLEIGAYHNELTVVPESARDFCCYVED